MNKEIKVVTFWSHCPGSGASFTALNAARLLSKKEVKCAVFDFDLIAPSFTVYFNSKDLMHGIDSLIPYVAGNNLTTEILEGSLQKNGFINWLCGTGKPEHSSYFKVEDFSKIIDIAKEVFDVLILDTSGIINNAATYVAIKRADKLFIVTDKDTVKIRRYNQIKSYIQSEARNTSIILNTSFDKTVPIEKEEIEDFYGIENAFELPNLGPKFVQALNNGKWYEYMEKNKHTANLYNRKLEEIIKKAGIEVPLQKGGKLFG